MDLADSCFVKGDLLIAQRLYTSILKDSPFASFDFFWASYRMATILNAHKQYDAAIEYLKQATGSPYRSDAIALLSYQFALAEIGRNRCPSALYKPIVEHLRAGGSTGEHIDIRIRQEEKNIDAKSIEQKLEAICFKNVDFKQWHAHGMRSRLRKQVQLYARLIRDLPWHRDAGILWPLRHATTSLLAEGYHCRGYRDPAVDRNAIPLRMIGALSLYATHLKTIDSMEDDTSIMYHYIAYINLLWHAGSPAECMKQCETILERVRAKPIKGVEYITLRLARCLMYFKRREEATELLRKQIKDPNGYKQQMLADMAPIIDDDTDDGDVKEPVSKKQKIEDTYFCIACCEAPRSIVFGCNHLLMCDECAKRVNTCPNCRKPILHFNKVFF